MFTMRLVSDNAAERSNLTASTEASASMRAANLKTSEKFDVWRATATAATLTLTWDSPEPVSCVAFLCNGSPSTQARVRGYSDSARSNQLLDTGNVLACPAPAVRLRGWTPAQAASAYANGGGAIGCVWFNEVQVKCLVVDITDTGNLQGYFEAAYLFAGPYWSPAYNAAPGVLTPLDSTSLNRSGAGSQSARVGTIARRLQIPLSILPPADRTTFMNYLRNSRAYPVFVSLYPGSTDLSLERDNMIIGRRTKDSELARRLGLTHASTIEIEEI